MITPVAGLAFCAGALDIGTIIRLGDVFASVMTGNLILLGLAVANKSSALLGHAGAAIFSYCIGVAISVRIMQNQEPSDTGWPPGVTTALLVELAALIMFALGWFLTDSHPGSLVQIFMLAMATMAMGMQSTAVRYLPGGVATTYLTGTLTAIVMGFTAITSKRSRSGLRNQLVAHRFGLVALSSAVTGAATGGLTMSLYPVLLPVLPLVAIGGTTLMVSIRQIH